MAEQTTPPPVEIRIADGEADMAACFAVRTEVFVVEQSVPESIEYDAYDAVAVHVLAVGPDGEPLDGRHCAHGRLASGLGS